MPALEVVPARLVVEVVAAVAERVLDAQVVRTAAGDAHDVAPGVVLILNNELSGDVRQTNNVALGVMDVVYHSAGQNCRHDYSIIVVVELGTLAVGDA